MEDTVFPNRPVPTPMVVEISGNREAFDRSEKMMAAEDEGKKPINPEYMGHLGRVFLGMQKALT